MARSEPIRENYRVEVYPRSPGDFGYATISGQSRTAAEEARICEGLVAAIKKHVGKFDDDRGHVAVNCDVRFECQHCGSRWTEESPTYNGGCCEEDEAANPLAPAPGDHWSDCATNNEPALPNGPCDCGQDGTTEPLSRSGKTQTPTPSLGTQEEQDR